MKENEIRRGIKSIIQATVREAERFEAVPSSPEVEAKVKEPVASKTLTMVQEPEPRIEREPEVAVTIPVVEVRKSGQIKIKTHYYPIPNDLIDTLAPHLDPVEEVIYHRLYRLSWGWGRATCRVSIPTLKNQTMVNSQTTIRKALKGLIDKHYIIPITNEKHRAYDNQDGTLYRVLLPHEILLGKTYEGIFLCDIPQNGLSEHILQRFDPSFFDTTKSDTTKNEVSKNDTTKFDTSPASAPEAISGEVSKNDTTDFDPHVQTIYKDMYLKTLSHDELIENFYRQIGQTKISKRERERAEEIYKTLKDENFSEEEIVFAVEWTLCKVKEVRSFTILEHTIGQALKERGLLHRQHAQEEQRRKEQQAEQERCRREAEENAKLEAYLATLSPVERETLESQARDMMRAGGVPDWAITSMALEAKVKELVRKERFKEERKVNGYAVL